MPEGTENKTEEEPTMKNNTYFEELNQIACTFEKAHEAHKALKQQIIDEKGWDSEELKAWYKEEEENFQYPISAGACKAYRAWRYSETVFGKCFLVHPQLAVSPVPSQYDFRP